MTPLAQVAPVVIAQAMRAAQPIVSGAAVGDGH